MVAKDNESLEAGKILAHASPGEEVVITGTAGLFPDSDNVTEFADKLFSKVDLISGDSRRWLLDHPEIPQRTGKLNMITKFDAGFFEIHHKQAHAMDPMGRILLEKVAEAIIDAGYNPAQLKGSRLGVFVGACFSETEKTWFYEKLQVNGFGVTGCARAMLANRISYWLGVTGPSYTVDTACSSSMYAIEHGYRAIREGLCDSAIIAGTNLCLHPYVSLQFSRLGVLSIDGSCKCFDEAANGYCRSEAISVMFLQKKKDARRIYATLVHAKTNCDGYKEEGITFPSGQLQQTLLEQFYSECNIDPASLAWVEAHGTGTKVGDPEEVKAIENVFCKNRKGALKIGSLKSNCGHSEPASGLLSITKVIIAMETGFIPPNINYNNPRKDIPSLTNGTIEVIQEKTSWDGGLVGVNSFGFGGANCHVLLNWNEKNKVNQGLPTDDLPRLVALSGRTQQSIDSILTFIEDNPIDVEYVKLYHEIFKDEIPGFHYRGYTLLSTSGKITRDIQFSPSLKKKVWYFFPFFGIDWTNQAQFLMKIPLFAQSIAKASKTLKAYNVDVLNLLKDKNITPNCKNPAHWFLKTSIMQLVLASMLKSIKGNPDGIIGVSGGEIICAYMDGCLSFEEALNIIYQAAVVLESNQDRRQILLIELPLEFLKSAISNEVEVVLSGPQMTVFCGPENHIESIVERARKNNVAITIHNIPSLNCKAASKLKAKLLPALNKVFNKTKKSSGKWLSSTSDSMNGNHSISAEYFCDCLVKPVLLNEQLNNISSESAIVEISPKSFLSLLIPKKLKKNRTIMNIMDSKQKDCINSFLSSLGKIYECGLNLDLAKLYPEVSFPVSRGTSMISPLLQWNHTDDWYVASYRTHDKITTGERTVKISIKDEEHEYISGHVVDGRNLFPATGYLVLVWESLAVMNAKYYGEAPVVFENVRFNRATNVPKDGAVDFNITIQRNGNNFEIVESGAAIVTGKVYLADDISSHMSGVTENNQVFSDSEKFVLSSRDLYKELRLRGYNYKGLFRSMMGANLDGSVGSIKWHNNWVAFMDNMLQIQILQNDSRGLFVPTGIQKVVIDPKKHIKMVQSLPENNKDMTVYHYKHVHLISCGGIEIRGMNVSAISKRKQLGEPVLEKYVFVPYESNQQDLSYKEVMTTMVHTALDDIASVNISSSEVGNYKGPSEHKFLLPTIMNILENIPLIQPDLKMYLTSSEKPEDLPAEIVIEDKKLPGDKSIVIAVAYEALQEANSELLLSLIESVKENGFILTREKTNVSCNRKDLKKCSSLYCEGEFYILLKKVNPGPKKTVSIAIPVSEEYSWIKPLQNMLKSDEIDQIVLTSMKEPLSGIMGFTNCLRKEGYASKIKMVMVWDENAPEFSLDNPFYANQIDKDLAINVYKNGVWGSYRHLSVPSDVKVDSPHAFVTFATRGDLSSLIWSQGHLNNENLRKEAEKTLIQVYYSALNFRDVMTATGKLANEVVESNRLLQDCVQGLEFSGRNSEGKRVMGIIRSKGICNTLDSAKYLVWEIPDEWSLEEAATVPCVYGTIVYGLDVIGNLKKGDSVLIHAGSGGIGQAAITYCLFHGCNVFTTVGTPEKREFLKKKFPQLLDSHIGNSRDTSFEQMIVKETNGRGVDIVMNSLAEEKLLASVRCLARGGKFLELGKFDMSNNNPLGMEFLMRDACFHGIMLTVCFDEGSIWKNKLWALMNDGIRKGAIKPFSRTVFERDQVEQALRYMAAGKHIGKVLIKIRDEEPEKILVPSLLPIKAKQRFYCSDQKSYIITGGLGGFGLELTDWLVLRNARKIILSSRQGIKNGYQASRINLWKSYEADVRVVTDDITTEEGIKNILKAAIEMGPVGGIFNLSVVLKDALFENQTVEDFKASMGPKAVATKHFDKLSRQMCPELDHFVIFSSVSCGRGNNGQTNYGMANSVMERICEKRKLDGLPATAIEWGAVGDVGLVANMLEDNTEIVIGGTLPQKIDSCLDIMDNFLHNSNPILASMVVAEKKAGYGSGGNIVETVANIIGLRDLKSVSLHSTLAELGMDSMMAVEIKQTLEREFEVFLTPQDIRSMTFAKLDEIADSKNALEEGGVKESGRGDEQVKNIMNLIKSLGDEELSIKSLVNLSSLISNTSSTEIKDKNQVKKKVFFLAGLEGSAQIFEPLASNLNCDAICIQYDNNKPFSTIVEIANEVEKRLLELVNKEETCNIVSYSFGSIVSLEVCRSLENKGYKTNLCLIDGSPELFVRLVTTSFDATTDEGLQITYLLGFASMIGPKEKIELETKLKNTKSWDERLNLVLPLLESISYSVEYKRNTLTTIFNRLKAVANYPGFPEKSLNGKVTLIKPTTYIFQDSPHDYGMSKLCKKEVDVHVFEGTHITVLENPQTAELINSLFL